MVHTPGHHTGPIWERLRIQGPLVEPGAGHREIVALPSDPERKAYLNEMAALSQRMQKRLMAERAAEIEAGLVHQTPAMEEALVKLEKAREREEQEA